MHLSPLVSSVLIIVSGLSFSLLIKGIISYHSASRIFVVFVDLITQTHHDAMRAIDPTWRVFAFSNRQDLIVFFFMVCLYPHCCLFHMLVKCGHNLIWSSVRTPHHALSTSQQTGAITFTSFTAVPGIPGLSTELISTSRAFHILDALHHEHFTAAREGASTNYLNMTG